MREIIFRGMTLDGEWVYGLLAMPKQGTPHKAVFISNEVGRPFAYEVRPETVGQYTGLKDKNGTKIFEGDILHGISISGTIAPCVVEWDTGGFVVEQICERCSYADDLYSNVKYSEIHGNIHETET